MAIYKETYTKPLPPTAELFVRNGERFAKWIDNRGKKRTAKVSNGRDGTDRVTLECTTHTAKYRDGAGLVRKVATGCRTKDAADSVLSDLRGRAELVRANVMTPSQDAAADHATAPLSGHLDAYRDHLTAKGCVSRRVGMVHSRLKRLASECPFGRLPDMHAAALERWLVLMTGKGVSAATRNGYREAAVGFGNWCRRTNRLIVNPFTDVPLANVKADRRHHRRALTEDELRRLLIVARHRPLADFGRASTKAEPHPTANKKRSNWTRAAHTFDGIAEAGRRGRLALAKRPDYIAELDLRGRERALIYKMLVLTGLRKGELASLTVAQLYLEVAHPFAVLNAADEKNRKGSEIPLRGDLAADVRTWLVDKLAERQAAARLKIGEPVPMRLPPATRLFNVPSGLIRILDRDLMAACIPKRDERDRVVDVHALRVSFGTHLSKGGVTLRTAQAAMRHSTPTLTANVYTDPKLLDVAGAMDSLPWLPLNSLPDADRQKATGTDNATMNLHQNQARSLVPTLVPILGNRSIFGSIGDKAEGTDGSKGGEGGIDVNAYPVTTKTPLTVAVNGVHQERANGFEPSTFTLGT